MADSAERLNYMKKFCSIATRLEIEKDFWLRMRFEVSKRIDQNSKDARQFIAQITNLKSQLNDLGTARQPGIIPKYNKCKKYKRNWMICLFLLGVLAFITIEQIVARGSENIRLSFIFASVLDNSIIILVIFIIYFVMWIRLKNELDSLLSGSEAQQQRALLETGVKNAEHSLTAAKQKAPVLQMQKQEIEKALQQAEGRRRQFYASGAIKIHIDYQNYNAMKAFSYYLDTTRVNTIEGHGGLYDTYAEDCKHEEHMKLLREMDRHAQQRHEETIRTMNYWGSRINQQLGVVARNTAISAAANVITAANSAQQTRYMEEKRAMDEEWRNRVVI